MQGRFVLVAAMAAMTALTGCRFGNDKPETATSSGSGSTSTTNHAPTIGGTPVTKAAVNTAYTFSPTASDADGDKLTFQIANKPAWASFDSVTGRLYGTPSSTSGGTFSNVQISVSDGKASTSLPSFSIAVANTATIGNATLSWQAPSLNADGTPLTNLAGYVIRYGNDLASLTQKVTLNNPGLTTYVVENLPAGVWYFTLSSVNGSGVESNPTYAVSLVIS